MFNSKDCENHMKAKFLHLSITNALEKVTSLGASGTCGSLYGCRGTTRTSSEPLLTTLQVPGHATAAR